MSRKFWGWGDADFQIPPAVIEKTKQLLQMSLGIQKFNPITPPRLEDLHLRSPRFNLPSHLITICKSDTYDRASHTYGKSYRDIWRGLYGHFDNPPDYVAYPKTESEIMELMNFAQEHQISLIPYGGGSSVCGGVESTQNPDYQGVISVDMQYFNQVLEIDQVSRCARIQAGIYGPALEKQLKPHQLTLRHYPQSFEFSTLGGWLATRSGGHFATVFTHIDDFVESIRMITPQGILQTRRLPASGAGPSEERLILGSEGIFGIITEAWMRLQAIPKYKATQAVKFKSFTQAVEAARLLAQSGLNPSNARLIDPLEAFGTGLGDGISTIIILGFESANHSVSPWMQEALAICQQNGGTWQVKPENTDVKADENAEAWKKSFLHAPYLRDEMMQLGVIMETFETATTWDNFPHFHQKINEIARQSIQEICGAGTLTCRFTHLYPDGPAPYYTIIARGEQGKELAQWDKIKALVSQAIIDYGGTITHHHAVGKDHQPYYAQQMSEPFNHILKSVKNSLDPQWILNPEVLIVK
jgi:alkyldihydroxyacetonephosphate synthase